MSGAWQLPYPYIHTARYVQRLQPPMLGEAATHLQFNHSALFGPVSQSFNGWPDAGWPDAGWPDAGWPDAGSPRQNRTGLSGRPWALPRDLLSRAMLR
ncbi:uncharacterized protein UV8b_07871 [Ustilaginoidea virens]|uniref:Uncharacterized protein n=1 Tax=Ustilaginoidea virens TaxID=1159556 RepID=A0A8E5HXU2_USTVR|nr:uncharacterized protein UV8b_07871 [Ustilaginoidea virens]QUC23630.1 hypothetical protein UV8b_07871 [Ustilaginoidea virens]